MLQILNARSHVETLIAAALESVEPAGCVESAIAFNANELLTRGHRIELGERPLVVIAIGKAAIPMTNGFIESAGARECRGVVITKEGQTGDVSSENFELFYSGHPISNPVSVKAAERVLEVLADLSEQDTVVFLISGGGSALCAKPTMKLDAWQELSEQLLASGCDIGEFNIIRQQLDQVKGGRLAEAAFPAKTLTLILSDVVGDSAEIIASGPTVPRAGSAQDAVAVLNKYDIQVPNELDQIAKTNSPPQTFDAPFEFVGNLDEAAKACLTAAQSLGFDAVIRKPWLTGPAKQAGESAAQLFDDLVIGQCLILGGETTVQINGSGTGEGGRNQELALAAAIAIDGAENIAIASFATDGEDGPTDAAGALVTGSTVTQGNALGLNAAEYLANNDSYSYFDSLGDHLIRTGPTGTNVNDLLFLFKYAE